ncbi:hypothetical protein QIT84_gp021 [Pseudomonas phage PP9W2]|uniref:Uncharacterized protein n=1 Tax=Pseudomonas phage PP9W2 TaxID=2914450 RepID=A0A9E6YJU5_9CAUD|nr:hypothetical protein QIT84_gp021 [Pseudomonas phage PP9W2]ULG00146.1 hypothetical protein [Pseudomonas phage PP9W2]
MLDSQAKVLIQLAPRFMLCLEFIRGTLTRQKILAANKDTSSEKLHWHAGSKV